jgi:putative chitinase
MNIDKEKFLFIYEQQEFKTLSDLAQRGLLDLLACMEADEHLTDVRWIAYMLATTQHEVGGTWQPIHEHGSQSYFIGRYGSQTRVGKELGNDTPEEGADYAGRGFPQVTGESNYEMAESALRKEYPDVVAKFESRTGKKFDLTVGDQPGDSADPDNMMDPEIAYCVMSYAMRTGAFTGVGLSKYFNSEKTDWLNARKIINGLDCAAKIAGYAVKFEAILKECVAA